MDNQQMEFPHNLIGKKVSLRTPATWYEGILVNIKSFDGKKFFQIESPNEDPKYINHDFIESIKEKK